MTHAKAAFDTQTSGGQTLTEVTLPSGKTTPSIGFGPGSIMQIPSADERLRLLEAAYDAGLRHFDLARMYGLGQAEAEMGRFLKLGKPDVTVATKFGIHVGKAEQGLRSMQSVVRRIIRSNPAVKKLVKRVAGKATAQKDYGVEAARSSLQTSLKELGVDRIEMLFVHEPAPDQLTDPALIDFLEDEKAKGTFAEYGISGRTSDTVASVNRFPALGRAIQVPHDAFAPDLGPVKSLNPSFLVTYMAIKRTLPIVNAHFKTNPADASPWSDRLGYDLTDTENLGPVLLAACQAANDGGMVLFFSSRPKRIIKTVEMVTELGSKSQDLLAFTNWVGKTLPRPSDHDSGF